MNQSQALLLFGVTDLALGLAFLYLWRYILPRRYAILLAVARGWAVLEAVTLLLQIRYPAAAGLGAAARPGSPSRPWAFSSPPGASAARDGRVTSSG